MRQPLPDDERRRSTGTCVSSTGSPRTSTSSTERSPKGALDDDAMRRLMTITGVNLDGADAGVMAAIGDIGRFREPREARKLLSA